MENNPTIIKSLEKALRPFSLNEFLGKEGLKERLRTYLDSSRIQEIVLDHCLFYGPPGTGKTTLAYVIAHQQNKKIISTTGPALTTGEELYDMLISMEFGSVLFIDEIHRINHRVEEMLYPVMEDFSLDPKFLGSGYQLNSQGSIDVPRFTLIGATTRPGLLSEPFRDRFGIVEALDFYDTNSLTSIVQRSAMILEILIDPEACLEIAHRSRGTPRVANTILRRIKDYSVILGKETVLSKESCVKILSQLQIDSNGLTISDKRFLEAIINKFGGGPVGLETLSHACGEDLETITDTIEPYLQRIGFIARTQQGRIATQAALMHMEKERNL